MDEEGENILLEENYYQLLNVSKTVNNAQHALTLNAYFTLSLLYNAFINLKSS